MLKYITYNVRGDKITLSRSFIKRDSFMKAAAQSFKIGDYQGFAIQDDSAMHTVDYLIGGAESQEKLVQAAKDLRLDPGKIPFHTNVLLVRTGDRNVLIDTGSGKRPYPGEKEGRLIRNLESLGINPSQIDDVVITHSDYDHIGGILDEDGQPEFPNAHFYLSAHSWWYWFSSEGRSKIAGFHNWPKERIDFVWGTYSTIRDRLMIVDYEVEFLPGFYLYQATGHRCDHDALKIESAGEVLIHISDALIHPLVMAQRGWYYAYDVAPEEAVETKDRLLGWFELEKALLFATHFPFPGLGTMRMRGTGWEWEAGV